MCGIINSIKGFFGRHEHKENELMNTPAIYLQRHVASYVALTEKERMSVQRWTEVCLCIDRAVSAKREIVKQAERFTGVRGFSEGRINTVYYKKWVNGGRDWRALLRKKSDTGPRCVNLLLDVYRRYCDNNTRSEAQAWREMMCDLCAGRVLKPGDVTWADVFRMEKPGHPLPECCPYSVARPPRGCSERNMRNRAERTPFDRVATRIGINAAASTYLPVLTTRVGLEVAEVIQFDDMQHDALCNYPGNSKAYTAREFAAVDVFSACRFAFYLRPTMENKTEEGKTRRNELKEVEFRRLVCQVLCSPQHGYRAAGTTLIGEHGTACFRPELRELLTRYDSAIQFADSAVITKQVHQGLFPGGVGGNFRCKGLLEGQHALAHSYAASLPGQTGSNSRINRPEQLKGVEDYNNKIILKAYAKLMQSDPERAAMLQFPTLFFHDYAKAILGLYGIMNARTNHRIEGYREAGLVVSEFRLDDSCDKWLPQEVLLKMEPERAAAIRALLQSFPEELTRARLMSPQEVYNRGSANLKQVSKWLIPDILGEPDSVPVVISKDNLIAFRRRDIAAEQLVYHGSLITPGGFNSELAPGGKFLLYVNPYNTAEAFLRNPEDGRVVGTVSQYDKPCPNNLPELHAAMGKRSHARKMKSLAIDARHEADQADREAMIEHNEAVMTETLETPSQLFRRERNEANAEELTQSDFDAVNLRDEEDGITPADISEIN